MKLSYWRAAAPLAVVALSLLVGSGVTASNQQRPAPAPTPSACPTVRVSCPDTVSENQPLTFTADVSGGDQNVTPTFNWTVSAGTISSGQGTSSITVDTTGVGGQTVTATVDVGGYDRTCSTSSSCTTSVTHSAAPAKKVGEYLTPDLSANKAQLDNFINELQRDPTAQGYLIAYGGRTSRPEDAQKAADNATNYTMNVRKMDGARTLSGMGGYREKPTIELWIAPAGGAPPSATPTVDAKDVKPAPPKPAATPKKKP
ncbi:MAG: hypothetical protein ACJ741_06440 [Pyrinomonadaceae bacterium]